MPAISEWCAIVIVTPELSSNAVFSVGIIHGPIVWNGSMMSAGEPVAPGCVVGQTALKSGHRIALSRSPSVGIEYTRAQYSAPKKAPKNITSEKMNQLMLQRNEMSIFLLYRPPSLSRIASPNHWTIVKVHKMKPARSEYLPHSCPLIHWPAPRMIRNMLVATIAGWREGAGTK